MTRQASPRCSAFRSCCIGIVRIPQSVWLHVSREGADKLHAVNFATDAEREAVKRDNRGLAQEAYRSINFVCWRRSALIVLCTAIIFHVSISLWNIKHAHDQYVRLERLSVSHFNIDFVAWREGALDPENGTEPEVSCFRVERSLEGNLTSLSDLLKAPPIPGVGSIAKSVVMKKDPKLSCGALRDAHGDAACSSSLGLMLAMYTVDFTSGCPWSDFCKMPFHHACPVQCGSYGTAMCRDPGNLVVEGYARFSRSFAMALYRSLQAQAAQVTITRSYLMALLNICGLVSLFLALCRWTHWARSQRLVMVSWCLLFLAPFVLSSVPVRLFLQADEADGYIKDFLHVSREFWKPEEGTKGGSKADLLPSCEELRGAAMGTDSYRMFSTYKNSLRDACKKCPGGGWSTWFDWRCYVFSFGEKNLASKSDITKVCNEYQEGSREFDNAVEEFCEVSRAYVEQREQQAHGTAKGWSKFVQSNEKYGEYGWKHAKILMESSIGLGDAMSMLLVLFPAALSVAPALLQASTFVKRLLPESSFPGVMIVLLPWLYTPMTWAVFNAFAQGVGDLSLTAGLIAVACAPMFYTIVGRSRGIEAPMNAQRASSIFFQVSLGMNVLSVVGLALVLIGMKNTSDAILERAAAADLLEPFQGFVYEELLEVTKIERVSQLISALLFPLFKVTCAWVVKKNTNCLAAVDFIVQQITNQHQFDNMVMLRDTLQNRGMLTNMGARSIIALSSTKDREMDGMVELSKLR